MSAETVRELSPAEKAEKQNQAVCRAIFAAQEDLDIDDKTLRKILGGRSLKTISRWKEDGEIPKLEGHLREATSHFIAILRSLAAIFSNSKDRSAWIKTPHPELEHPPIELMCSFTGLSQVRQYLDYVRGRGA
jgi:uncharacterized protein (DUF2384 family)